MLEIKNINVKYDNKTVLENFSLNMKKGEIISIVGESGSGKTTVIRSVMGLLPINGKVTQGDILFDGNSIMNMNDNELCKIRGTEMAMIFQDSGLMLNPIRKISSQFTEYIRTHSKVSKKQAYNMALKSLEDVKLPDCKNVMKSYPFELSGGMRQRVGIAMALTFHPKLLLADEPTSALDVTTQAQIVHQLIEMHKKSNTGIIIVTHNLGIAVYMSDRIIVMKDGLIVEEGDRNRILKNPADEYTRKLIKSVPVFDGESYV